MGYLVTVVTSVAVIIIALAYLGKSECPNIITRKQWNASAPASVEVLSQNPPPYVVVHHSVTRLCNTTADCKALVKSIQNFHMITNGWEDIGYNFLIGGDGNIYEGRGWGIHGAHSIPYNARSLGICLTGNFEEYQPLENQLQALKDLITCSLEKDKLTTDYHLIAHNQTSATLCPGKNLFGLVKLWPHFDNDPK